MDDDTNTITLTLPARAAQSLLLIAQLWVDDEHLDRAVADDTYIDQDDVWTGIAQLETATQAQPALPRYHEVPFFMALTREAKDRARTANNKDENQWT